MQCLRCHNEIKSTLAGSSIEYHYCKKCRAILDQNAIILSYDDISYDESWDDITKDESEEDE
jgi:hypothetical protein